MHFPFFFKQIVPIHTICKYKTKKLQKAVSNQLQYVAHVEHHQHLQHSIYIDISWFTSKLAVPTTKYALHFSQTFVCNSLQGNVEKQTQSHTISAITACKNYKISLSN